MDINNDSFAHDSENHAYEKLSPGFVTCEFVLGQAGLLHGFESGGLLCMIKLKASVFQRNNVDLLLSLIGEY